MKQQNKFYRNAVYFITGAIDDISVTGHHSRVEAVRDVLLSSRKLYEALESETSTLNEVMDLTLRKKAAGKKYEAAFGKKWLL